jgi:hypothetical protein
VGLSGEPVEFFRVGQHADRWTREAKSLFNYAIGQQLDWHRNAEAACLRRFHINDELK